MKRYVKPRLDKRAILLTVTAQTVPSDFTPPQSGDNEDGNDGGGVII